MNIGWEHDRGHSTSMLLNLYAVKDIIGTVLMLVAATTESSTFQARTTTVGLRGGERLPEGGFTIFGPCPRYAAFPMGIRLAQRSARARLPTGPLLVACN